jgi:DNA-binding response OmpR family regulator
LGLAKDTNVLNLQDDYLRSIFGSRVLLMQEEVPMSKYRVLLADDNDDIREIFQDGLEKRGFEVRPASTVNEALRLISTEQFDVLLSDLHMPDAGDGFTIVSAMRHTHPKAVTLVISGYPAVQEAMSAILLEADQVLVKPVGLDEIVKIISNQLLNLPARSVLKKQRVAEILERDADATIRNWITRVERNEELTAIPLSFAERTGHLPLLLGDLVQRLRLAPNAKVPVSYAAGEHGILRRKQGYTLPMLVEESRNLQVSIFNTLQNNLGCADFSTLLIDVMTIADEVDFQLKQSVIGYTEGPRRLSQSSSA